MRQGTPAPSYHEPKVKSTKPAVPPTALQRRKRLHPATDLSPTITRFVRADRTQCKKPSAALPCRECQPKYPRRLACGLPHTRPCKCTIQSNALHLPHLPRGHVSRGTANTLAATQPSRHTLPYAPLTPSPCTLHQHRRPQRCITLPCAARAAHPATATCLFNTCNSCSTSLPPLPKQAARRRELPPRRMARRIMHSRLAPRRPGSAGSAPNRAVVSAGCAGH